jgi:hypothetical protein
MAHSVAITINATNSSTLLSPLGGTPCAKAASSGDGLYFLLNNCIGHKEAGFIPFCFY